MRNMMFASKPLAPHHGSFCAFEIAIEEGHDLGGSEAFCKGRKTAYVRHQAGDRALFPTQLETVGIVEHTGDHFVADIASKDTADTAVRGSQFLVALGEAVLQALEGQMGGDPCDHFLSLTWLRNVIDSAKLEAVDFVVRVAEGGQEEHRGLARGGIGFELATRLKTIDAWQHDIEENKRRVCLTSNGQGFFTAWRHEELQLTATQCLP